MKRYLCLRCGFLYDEALGLPEAAEICDTQLGRRDSIGLAAVNRAEITVGADRTDLLLVGRMLR